MKLKKTLFTVYLFNIPNIHLICKKRCEIFTEIYSNKQGVQENKNIFAIEQNENTVGIANMATKYSFDLFWLLQMPTKCCYGKFKFTQAQVSPLPYANDYQF